MAAAQRRGFAQRVARGLASLVYREIDVSRWEPALSDGPVLAVANHFGGLADGVLLVDTAPRMPRIVARDVIWRVPVVGRLATAMGMIPVHRAADGARSSNDQMFAAAYQALGEGEMVLIFPEGVTQDVPSIAEVRTGAARIALGARRSGVAGIRILPLGVHYEDKAGFRSRVLVNPGEPIDLDAWAEAQPDGVADGAEDRAAVEALTAKVDGALRHAAPDFPDWETVASLHTAARVVLDDVEPMLAARIRYGDSELLAARLNRVAEPSRSDLVDSSAEYGAALRRAKTSDRKVLAAHQHPARTWRWLRELVLLVALLPFALVGVVAAAVPLLLTGLASRLPVAPAVRATVVPAVALLVFLVEWAWLSWSAGRTGGWNAGVAALLLFPFFVAAVLLAAEVGQLLLRRWGSRRRPTAADLPHLEAMRRRVAEQAWGAL